MYTYRHVLLHAIHKFGSSCFPQIDQFWEVVISYKFIEECLVTYEFGDHEAVLPVNSHHEGEGHEDVGTKELPETEVLTLIKWWLASDSALLPLPSWLDCSCRFWALGTPYIQLPIFMYRGICLVPNNVGVKAWFPCSGINGYMTLRINEYLS